VVLLEISTPLLGTAHIEGDEVAAAEEEDDALAVGDGGGGGEVVALLVAAHSGADFFLPEDLAVGFAQAEGEELHGAFVGGGGEDSVAGDDGGAVAVSGHGGNPEGLGLVDGVGEVGGGGGAVEVGAAPLGPVVAALGEGGGGEHGGEDEGEKVIDTHDGSLSGLGSADLYPRGGWWFSGGEALIRETASDLASGRAK
jgi:hypothetical protein